MIIALSGIFPVKASDNVSASPPVTIKEEGSGLFGGLLFGQSHFYSVLLRGNGEAIVYSRIVVTNSEEEPLREFSFEIPKVSPTEMVMYQMKLPKECVRYDYNSPGTPCLEYQDPDYTRRQYYYYGSPEGKIEYKRISFEKEGNTYRFEIPEEVEPFKTTAFVLAYAAKGYVTEKSGLYKFQFETIKVPSRVKESRVVVDVDSDLYMKGKRSQVDYFDFPAYKADEMGAGDTAISNRELDRVVNEIGAYGQLMKEAKNLAPHEVFIVNGEYAKSWLRLQLFSIIRSLLVILLIFFAVYYLMKFLNKRNKKETEKTKNKNAWPITTVNLLISLISALSVFAVTIVLYTIERTGSFYFSYYYFFDIISFIVIALLYILIIFMPPIIVSLKNGWKSFVVILLGEFFWMLVIFLLFLVLYQTGVTDNYYYY
jgi:hypothetical protein